MRKFQGVKCPKCGKKGLNYANHPHAQGWKDYDRLVCSYCGGRFKLSAPNTASTRLGEGARQNSLFPADGSPANSEGVKPAPSG